MEQPAQCLCLGVPPPRCCAAAGYPGNRAMELVLERFYPHLEHMSAERLGQLLAALGRLGYAPRLQRLADMVAGEELGCGCAVRQGSEAALTGSESLGCRGGYQFPIASEGQPTTACCCPASRLPLACSPGAPPAGHGRAPGAAHRGSGGGAGQPCQAWGRPWGGFCGCLPGPAEPGGRRGPGGPGQHRLGAGSPAGVCSSGGCLQLP